MTFLDFAENYFKFNARSVSLCPEQSAFADIPFEAFTIRPTYQISSNHNKMYFWIRQTSPTKLNKGGHKTIVTWRLEFGNFVIECGQKAMLKLKWRWISSDEWMKKICGINFLYDQLTFNIIGSQQWKGSLYWTQWWDHGSLVIQYVIKYHMYYA